MLHGLLVFETVHNTITDEGNRGLYQITVF